MIKRIGFHGCSQVLKTQDTRLLVMFMQINVAKYQPTLIRETIRQLSLMKNVAWDFKCCLMNLAFQCLAETDPIRKYLFQDAKFHSSPIVR